MLDGSSLHHLTSSKKKKIELFFGVSGVNAGNMAMVKASGWV